MAESDAEIFETARRLIKDYGSIALAEARKMERDAINQRDAEAITYWRSVIEALDCV